uniref:DsbD domain-containing protein n=1 Tax=Ascaris lumbricoides TaxID=6252 RepID=A0A0M3HIF5_ASCLU
MEYSELLPYIPLSIVLIIPALFGVYQLLFTSLRSPIHFQQGIHDTTSWRSALSGALVAVSPFVCALPLSSGEFMIVFQLSLSTV